MVDRADFGTKHFLLIYAQETGLSSHGNLREMAGDDLCNQSRRRRTKLRDTAETSVYWKRLRRHCRRMRKKIQAVENTVDPEVGQAGQ